MKRLITLVACMLACYILKAQKVLTLKEAVDIGIKNNLDVNQADVLKDKSHVTLNQSRLSMLPDLNASANHGTNQGRSIDPYSNTFINQNVNYASYSASSNLLLSNGGALQNRIKSNRLGYEASQMELQQTKDNITINVILAYLNVLSAQDILEQSHRLVMVTDSQVNRLGILNQSGAIKPSDFYDLKGQLASDQISIVDNEAALETAKLNLLQLLNMPYDSTLQIEPISLEAFNSTYDKNPGDIYQTALQNFAQIKAVDLRTQSAAKNVKSLRGELFPTLSFGANVTTNYSSSAMQSIFLNSTEAPSADYVVVNGSQVPVITKTDNFNVQKISFSDQIKNNRFTTYNIALRIPLFNGNFARSRVKLAELDYKNTQLVEENTKTVLQQNIERAYVNLRSAQDKYQILLDQADAFEESFRAAEVRFNAGASTSIDYLIAKNNLDRTMTNMIIAKYEFALRSKILDYYKGEPLF